MPGRASSCGTRVAFGGATFSVMPDPGRLLGSIPVTVGGGAGTRWRPARLIDYLIVGEGEKGLEALAKSALCPDGGVPGLVYRKDGKIMKNPARRVSRLDALPLPDFSDTPPGRYHSPAPVLPYLSSRGCPWRRCAFCTHQKTYLHYREEHAEPLRYDFHASGNVWGKPFLPGRRDGVSAKARRDCRAN